MSDRADEPVDDLDVAAVVLVVDVANTVGSRPDGWWRDRAGATARLLAELAPLTGRVITAPDGEPLRVARLVAVLEGQARYVPAPDGIEPVRATADGDSAVAATASQAVDRGDPVLVVTADRGLRARLPAAARVAGPGWLLGTTAEHDR